MFIRPSFNNIFFKKCYIASRYGGRIALRLLRSLQSSLVTTFGWASLREAMLPSASARLLRSLRSHPSGMLSGCKQPCSALLRRARTSGAKAPPAYFVQFNPSGWVGGASSPYNPLPGEPRFPLEPLLTFFLAVLFKKSTKNKLRLRRRCFCFAKRRPASQGLMFSLLRSSKRRELRSLLYSSRASLAQGGKALGTSSLGQCEALLRNIRFANDCAIFCEERRLRLRASFGRAKLRFAMFSFGESASLNVLELRSRRSSDSKLSSFPSSPSRDFVPRRR